MTLELQKSLITQGPAYGIKQPLLIVNLTAPVGYPASWESIDAQLARVLGLSSRHSKGIDPSRPFFQQLALRLLSYARMIQTNAGLALHARGKILGTRQTDEGLAISSVAMPYVSPYSGAGLRVARWVFNSLQQLLIAENANSLGSELQKSFEALREELTQLGPRDTNTLRFVHAALQADIPHAWVTGPLFQYGWGAKQCLLNSSILETTPSMGVATARDKHACATLMRIGGLPVPDHGLAEDLPTAVSLAQKLGYPVVVKPANLDGGVGVAAGLNDEHQLTQAWESARRHSDKILVEKHLDGEDFRLIVLDGQMVWAVGRRPAGVDGDGLLTVAQLVEKANQDPRRGHHQGATLRPMRLDEEAMDLLQEQDLTLENVPVAGRFVSLRRAANISSGGTPTVVTERVHPDNRLLVERAVALLRLDLAGVDLIVPNIEKSWRETGGGIIEINAQPQMIAASQTHLYAQVLRSRLPGGGRIPVLVLMGDERIRSLAQEVYQLLRAQGQDPGLAIGRENWFPDGATGQTNRSAYHAARALLMHKDVQVMLWVIHPEDVLLNGLPIDRFDGLVVTDSPNPDQSTSHTDLRKALPMILPHCAGWVIADDSIQEQILRTRGLPTDTRFESGLSSSTLSSQILKRIQRLLGGDSV
nr:hypothetical protein [Aromatoleum aromaticum]